MDAIMIALVAVLLANTDGRSGSFLSRLIATRDDGRVVVVAAAASFIVNALVAAVGGSLLHRMVGQGVVALFVAFALATAAVALLWRGRLMPDDGAIASEPPARLGVRLLLLQFGDRSHFLIAALAATSGAGLWAAAGGFVGWLLATLPFLAFGPALAATELVRYVRLLSAALLAIWAVATTLRAFGLIAGSA
jgi:putative Ca2+/H+ antiporter (TMEM165/GDT1 family)